MDHKPRILVVDDDPINREIVREFLEDEDLEIVEAEDGAIAWRMMTDDPNRFDVILLDRMMPHMDGIEVLSRMRSHPELRFVPAVIQTARAVKEDVAEAVSTGAYYYLTKPFEDETLSSILKTAIYDSDRYQRLKHDLESASQLAPPEPNTHIHVKTLDDARNVAVSLAKLSAESRATAIGLSEFIVNGIEHGNLGIGYEEKTWLIQQGRWEDEINKRLAMEENRNKFVDVCYHNRDGELQVSIKDQGQGFRWQDYIEFAPERGLDNHGRGIAVAKDLSFDYVEFGPLGNEVAVTIVNHH